MGLNDHHPKYATPGTLSGDTLRHADQPRTTQAIAELVGTTPRLAYAALARHRSRDLVRVVAYEAREGAGAPATIWRLTPAGRALVRARGGAA